MSRIPQHIIDQILARVSIADLIGEYTRVERKGRGDQYMAICPFHREKTPSLSISDSKGVYYCFGCQARGNAISFLRDHNGLSFRESMEFLSRRAGIEIPQDDEDVEESKKRRRAEEAYLNVMRTAMQFYEDQLWGEKGKPARDYLESRGIDEETAKRFHLGYAPPGWSNLIDEAARKQMSGRLLERAGLAIERDRSGHYDRFRDRVMFPVLDVSGRCLAFSGRALEADNPAKYINSPETRFYTKGRHLFGLQAARKAIRREDELVLVEGNFDVVSLHAQGIDNVVAPLGTALTEEQCHLVLRFTERVVIAFDGDSAGHAAANKAFYTLLGEGLTDIAKARFETDEDPDDYLQEHGPEALRKLIHEAPSMVQSTLDDVLTPAIGTRDPAVKREALLGVGKLLSAMDDEILTNTTAQEVARRLDVDERLIRKAAARAHSEAQRDQRRSRDPRDEVEQREKQRPSSPPLNTLEIGLLRHLHETPKRLEVVDSYHLYPLLRHRKLAEVLEEAANALNAQGTVDIAAHIEASEDPTLEQSWYQAATDSHGFVLHSDDDAFESIVRELLIAGLQRQIKEVDRLLASEYREREMDEVIPLLRKRKEILESIDTFRRGLEQDETQ
jgi:DNA primase